MKAIWLWLFPSFLFGLAFGGDSTATTENKEEVKDMRVVGGDASANVSADAGSSVSIISTDHGAVAGGLQLGGQAIDASIKNADGLRATLSTLYSGALSFVKDANQRSQQAYSNANEQLSGAYAGVAGDLATAFTDSKAPDKNMLIVGGVVVVGLAAVMVFAAKKG